MGVIFGENSAQFLQRLFGKDGVAKMVWQKIKAMQIGSATNHLL